MSDATLEKVISDIEQLSPEGLRQLRRLVDEKLRALNQHPLMVSPPRVIGYASPPKDRTKEYEWLEQHRDEYADRRCCINSFGCDKAAILLV